MHWEGLEVGKGYLPARPVGVVLLHLHCGFLSHPNSVTTLGVQGTGGVHRGVGGGAPSGQHAALLRLVQPSLLPLRLAQQAHIDICVEEVASIDL